MKKYILFITLYLPVLLYSQNNMEIIWQSCFGGSQNEWVESIVELNNDYYVLGSIYSDDGNITNSHGGKELWLVKTDSIGNLLWEKCYGGSNTELATNIIKDSLGYLYLGGWVYSNDGDVQSFHHGGFDRWVVKIDNQGEIIWEKCYGGSGLDYGGTLELLRDGNILVYGATTSSDGDVPVNYGYLDVWLMIISPEGEILQSEVYGNIGQNNVFDIIETRDGGFFMACKAQEEEGMVEGDFHGNTDVWAVKLDTELNIEWQKLYGGSWDDYGYSGVLELDNGYLFLAKTNSTDFDVVGFHGIAGQDEVDIWAVRIDTIGNIIWQNCLGGTSWDNSGTLHQTEDGGFMIFGETKSNNGDVSGNNSNNTYSDIWMVKLNSEGEIIWQQCYGGLGSERLYKGVIQKSDHNWIVAGRTHLMSENSFDVNCDLHGHDDYWIFEIKDTTVGISQTPQNETLKVYPNPANNYVVFETENPANVIARSAATKQSHTITISNTYGQQITILQVKDNKTIWDTRSINSGVYFYSLIIDGKFKSGKVIVQH
jgi:hypothetical protein